MFIKALGWDCPKPKCKHITIVNTVCKLKTVNNRCYVKYNVHILLKILFW